MQESFLADGNEAVSQLPSYVMSSTERKKTKRRGRCNTQIGTRNESPQPRLLRILRRHIDANVGGGPCRNCVGNSKNTWIQKRRRSARETERQLVRGMEKMVFSTPSRPIRPFQSYPSQRIKTTLWDALSHSLKIQPLYSDIPTDSRPQSADDDGSPNLGTRVYETGGKAFSISGWIWSMLS